MLEGHFAKYRKLVPVLALINYLADAGQGPVSLEALLRALAFVQYLESHARRVYGAGGEGELAAAKAILKHIADGALQNDFSARDIRRHCWSGLGEVEQIQAGLDLLSDLDYLSATIVGPGVQGGRPKTTYRINPRIVATPPAAAVPG